MLGFICLPAKASFSLTLLIKALVLRGCAMHYFPSALPSAADVGLFWLSGTTVGWHH